MRRIKEILEPTYLGEAPAFWVIEMLNGNIPSKTCITAAENAALKEQEQGDWDVCWIATDMGEAYVLAKESITNTFAYTFLKFKV